MEIDEFDFEIEHRLGKKHGNANAVSQKPCRQLLCKKDIAGMSPSDQQIDSGVACTMLRLNLDAWCADQLAEQQAKDPELSTIYG